MAFVSMYTVYTDLFTKNTPENIQIRNSRDNFVLNAMIHLGYAYSPMPEELVVVHLFPLFKELTRLNPMLNVVLLYTLNGKDSSAIIIRNNKAHLYPTKQEAFNSISKISSVYSCVVTC